jgi:hypothetical protein
VTETKESDPLINPAVEVTGPEKVVEAIIIPLAQGFALQSVQRQVGCNPVCKANVTPYAEYYTFFKKERGYRSSPS